MRVLFDVNHPAHVHLFKNAIRAFEADGDDVLVTSREKEVTTRLLDEYGIEHRPLSTRGEGLRSLATEWTVREIRMIDAARRFRPDVLVSRLNPPVVHASKVVGSPNVIFNDTEVKSSTIDRLYSLATHAFVDVYCAPPSIEPISGRAVHHTVDFQELAYLHPNRFTPDAALLRRYGVEPDDPYFVVRFSDWNAYHDVGYRGFSPSAQRELVSTLAERGDVYVTSERPLPPNLAEYRLPIPPHLIHHLLYYADLYVGDSGTMSSEAAILGTPAVRTNSMVGDDTESIFRELEEHYGLLFSFSEEDRALEKAVEVLESPSGTWKRRRETLLSEKTDVTARMIDIVRDAAGAR